MENMTSREKLLTDNSGSPAFKYQSLKDEFNKKTIEKYSCRKLKYYYKKFKERLDEFWYIYADLFTEFVGQKFNEKNFDTKQYLDLDSVYISEIQNIYLNPINSERNHRKANWSVGLGFVSVMLGLFSIILAITTLLYPDKVKNLFSSETSTQQSPKIECCCLKDSINTNIQENSNKVPCTNIQYKTEH
jgi:hypothetical protein